jgi:2'-5' RNA ligase
MPDQVLLPDVPKAQNPTDSLFLAIFPDARTAAQIAELARTLCARHGLRGRPFAEVRFHISLYHLGFYVGVPERVVQAASLASAKAAATSVPPFEVNFDRAVSFPGRQRNRPFVLRDNGDNPALMEFHRRLGLALEKCGFDYDGNSRFTPHVTLLYDQQRIAEALVNTISWIVDELVLVHSLLGRARYIPVGCWRLHG